MIGRPKNELFTEKFRYFFWNKVEIGTPSECWIWLGSKFKVGYGQVWVDGGNHYAHRVSWEITYGNIPDKLRVLHKCDNRPCVNPNHLFLGTQADNMKDMTNKNRSAKGENHGQSKLTENDIREIRALYSLGNTSHRKLAKQFSVSRQEIRYVIRYNVWKHI